MKLVSTANEKPVMGALGANATTRKIHRLCGSQSWCGASRKNFLVTLKHAASAQPTMYCEKCFPAGKPKALFEVEV